MLIQYLTENALAIRQHPGAVQFQVSKSMLANLKSKFAGMKGFASNESALCNKEEAMAIAQQKDSKSPQAA